MIASILDKLDSLGNQHPHRLLYSYIDVNGNQIGGYTYQEFLRRTKVIAGVRKACQGRPVEEDAIALLAQRVEEAIRARGGRASGTR